MVQQETLRPGSKVFFFDTRKEPVTVLNNIDGEISVQLKNLVKTQPEQLYPVPLNAEIIIRSGFFKTDEFVFEHPVERIELEIDHRGVTLMHVHTHGKIVEVNSLHELQNAFYYYTNKELMFK